MTSFPGDWRGVYETHRGDIREELCVHTNLTSLRLETFNQPIFQPRSRIDDLVPLN